MENKTVIVTGGAKGIGAGIAQKYAENGYNIVINYRSNISEEFVSRLQEKTKVATLQGDISKYEDAKALIEFAIETFGKVDVLVNNAGITNDTLLMRMSPEQFQNVVDINLTGTFNTTQCISSVFAKQRSGSVVNLTSVVGVTGNAGQVNYAASKAGVIGLTKSVARELAKRGVTCNAVAPGFIQTDMTDKLNDKIKDKVKETIPAGKFGTIEDVADAVFFLSNAQYVNGQVLNVCGGMVM